MACQGTKGEPVSINLTKSSYHALAQELLKAIQQGHDTDELKARIEQATIAELEEELVTDELKLAFWINIYNAYIQLILAAHPEYYEDRRSFFKKPFISIAGEKLSFANIEHGIIRGSECELCLGYIKRPFPPKWERKLRVKKREPRVHFALNCGAKSCPPVAIYDGSKLDRQMDYMSKKYLTEHSKYDDEKKNVEATSLFSWFRGDFKGKKGVLKMLASYEVIPDTKVSLSYSKYDWTLMLDNFVDLPEGY